MLVGFRKKEYQGLLIIKTNYNFKFCSKKWLLLNIKKFIWLWNLYLYIYWLFIYLMVPSNKYHKYLFTCFIILSNKYYEHPAVKFRSCKALIAVRNLICRVINVFPISFFLIGSLLIDFLLYNYAQLLNRKPYCF